MKPNPDEVKENLNEESDYEAEKNLTGFFKLLLEIDQRIDPGFYKQLAKEQREKAERKLKKNSYAKL